MQRKYSEHIVQLCETHKVDVVVDVPEKPQWAHLFTPEQKEKKGKIGEIGLHAFPLQTVAGYAIALHEMGHLVSNRQVSILPQDRLAQQLQDSSYLSEGYLRNELDAWCWAREHALCWTKPMLHVENKSLKSYASGLHWNSIGLETYFTGRLKLEQWYEQYKGSV